MKQYPPFSLATSTSQKRWSQARPVSLWRIDFVDGCVDLIALIEILAGYPPPTEQARWQDGEREVCPNPISDQYMSGALPVYEHSPC